MPMCMADMVKNKGFLPSGASEVHIQRNQIRDIIFSLLPACVDPDPETKVAFKVDAIIANPPAYGNAPPYFMVVMLIFYSFFVDCGGSDTALVLVIIHSTECSVPSKY